MARRWTNEQLLDALRAAADDLGEPLRLQKYRAWRRHHPEAPGDQAVIRGFGYSWPEALRAAGLEPYGWTDEQLLDVVAACVADVGHRPTFRDYEGWRRKQADGTPSIGTIVKRFNTWTAALARVAGSGSRGELADGPAG